MLFEAIYLPAFSKTKPSRDIIVHPDLILYWENWGRAGDIAVVAEHTNDHRLLGCSWGRLFNSNRHGYGYISESIPELSVAVASGFINMGIGTKLIRGIHAEYVHNGFNIISLSVNKENPGVRLYLRERFQTFKESANDYVMFCDLDQSEMTK